MGTFLAIPFVIVIGVLMVFFPVPLAIVYGSLVLLIFVYFRLTKRWIMQEILAEHPSLRPEQIRLVEKTPIFFKYHPGAMLFLGMIVVVRFFSIPVAAILALREQWLLLPIPVITWILSGLTAAVMEPLTALEAYTKKSPNEGRMLSTLLEETYQEINRGVYSTEERNPDKADQV